MTSISSVCLCRVQRVSGTERGGEGTTDGGLRELLCKEMLGGGGVSAEIKGNWSVAERANNCRTDSLSSCLVLSVY